MKYAFDFHGVLQRYPRLFMPMMEDLLKSGNLVSVLSGPPKDQVEWELETAGYVKDVHFNHVLSVVDWLHYQIQYRDAKFIMKKDEHGRWWTDPDTWWSSKSKICHEFGIDILLDDQEQYSKYIVDERPMFLHVK